MSTSSWNETSEEKVRKVIRVDRTKSPINLIRNKFQNKETETKNFDKAETQQFSPIVEMMLKESKKDDLYYQLLKMMYLDDVSSEQVESFLGITTDELKNVVEELVFLGFLKYNSQDEVELTEDGIDFVNLK